MPSPDALRMREVRANAPDYRQRNIRIQRVRRAALTELAAQHPDEYRAIYLRLCAETRVKPPAEIVIAREGARR